MCDKRKAFEEISNLADGIAYGESEANALEILRICAMALEEPLVDCDVGTAEELRFYNTQTAYESLKKIHDLVNSLDENCGVDPIDVRDIAREALRKPPRNCDVGTPDEQIVRFRKYCAQFNICQGHPKLGKGHVDEECFAHWAQMPYTKGDTK